MASHGNSASIAGPSQPAGRDARAGGSTAQVIVDIGFRYQLTRLALIFERLAAPVLGLAAVVALFAICAWSGLFWALGPTGRMLLAIAFLPLAAFGFWQFRAFRWPTATEIEHRLDRSRPDVHRPLETLADRLAGGGDAFATALWQVHRLRAAEAAASLVARPGDARLRRKDPLALRFVLLLALLVTAFVAGDERQTRLVAAFDWSTPKVPPVPPRLDAWIDPPAYTGRPPIFLTGAVTIAPGEVIRAPVGATLTVRSTIAVPPAEARSAATPADSGRTPLLSLRHDAGLVEPPAPKAEAESAAKAKPAAEKPGVETIRRIIQADTQVAVLREGQPVADFRFAVIPDLPPKVMLHEVKAEPAQPERQSPGGIRVGYALEDDYGIARAELVIERLVKPGEKQPRTLLPPPAASISTRLGPGETAIATEDHPWAGEEVAVRLVVEDDLGQKAESETMRVTLPRRPFSQALARALVEQRKNLVFRPDNSQDVTFALDALLLEPERFMPKVADYLALDSIRSGIRSAGEAPRKLDSPTETPEVAALLERKAAKPADTTGRQDKRLVEMVERIYELALFLENGDMTDAERRLREAEARLREALEREAPQAEIRRLSEELRRAMEQFLREFAERALREQDRNADQDRQPSPSDRMLTQRDLNDMLRRIEEMARSGNMDEARRLLNELRQLMENLRMARRQDMDPRRREMGEQLEEIDRLQREQRDLRDRTFRQGQQRNQRGQQQQGQRQQGQRQQGQRQQGQEQGDGESEEDLQRQQQALRDRLKQLRDRMKQRGGQEPEGMGEAEEGMGDAEGQLGQGRPGQATEGQQRALDGMGKAAQGMAQQLDQQMGEGEGEGEGPGFGQPGPGNRGRADNRSDPLGRPQPNSRRDVEDNSRVQVPDQNTVQKSISERAEQVLRELRKRLGDFERPREELEYLERLLRQR